MDSPCVFTAVIEAHDLVLARSFWQHRYLRGQVILGDPLELAYQHGLGFPYASVFMVDPEGNVALTAFGPDMPSLTEAIYDVMWGDTDGDGLSDTWETTHFGDLLQGGDDDPDSDGSSNLEEQAAGTDPLDRTSRVILYVYKGGGTVWAETFVAPVSGCWLADRSRYVALEQGAEPRTGIWEDVPGFEHLTVSGAVTLDIAPVTERKYYRLRVWLE